MKVDLMTTSRQFVQSLPAFAVAANMLENDTAAAAPAPVAPAAGHFHPKGKAPSEFTKAVHCNCGRPTLWAFLPID